MEKQPSLMPSRDDQTPPFKGPIRTPPSFQGPMHSSTIMGSGSPSAYSERSLLTLREEETPEHIPSSLYEGISGYQVSMPETSPELDDSLPMVHGDYEDFHTIDWPRELARDRMRHRHLVKRKPESLMNRVYFEFDAISGWLCVFMIGVCAGLGAGAIDIGTSWMVDLRNGICPQRFWLNMEQCCWSSNETLYEGYKCSQWYSWSEMVGVYSSGAGQYVVDFIVYTIVSVSFALLAVFLIRTFAPYAVGGGIPELKTILSGFIIRGHLGKWTLIIKSVGVMLSVSAGLCLGKEGPLVHVACCIGNIIARLFPKFGNNEAKKREILSAAAAAGVSVAFGAPIGGVLFSLEEASYYFPLKTLWRSFFCALIAAFFLRSINPFGNDHMIAFYADYSTPWALIELIPFVFIGILGGLIGCMFIKGNVYWCKLRKNSKLGEYPIAEVLAVTLLTALMSFHNPYTRMDTSSLIAKLVRQCSPDEISDLCGYESNISSVHEVTHKALEGATLSRTLWQLILALIFKLGMMIVTIGMKVPAGLYIPSLAVGAIMGRIIGIGMEQIAALYPDSKVFPGEYGENCITPGMYAMVGAAAVLGGVTRMTVSLVVVMFEVTGGVRYIVPLMVAVMASKWVGDGISRRGIFEQLIQLNNYPYLDNKEEFEYTTLACDVMKPNKKEPLVVLLQDSMTVGDVELLLKSYQYNAFPVVVSRESQYLVGLVLRKDLQMALANARAKHGSITAASLVIFTEHAPRPWRRSPAVKLRKIVDLAPITITDQTPMETVIDMFKKLGLRQTLVIHSGKLLGCITRKDVLRHIKALENEEVAFFS